MIKRTLLNRTSSSLPSLLLKRFNNSGMIKSTGSAAIVNNFSSVMNRCLEEKKPAAAEEDVSKYLKTFNITSISEEGSLVVSTAGTCPSVAINMDEPITLGGTNQGPTPLELSLASLSGCEIITARYAARGMKMQIKSISCTKMSGVLDVRGLRGVAGVPAHFKSVDMVFEVETDESNERIDTLKERVERSCPVFQMFKAANVTMNCVWKRKD